MESSFKRGYDKTVNADGSINLSFKSEKIGAHSGANYAGMIILAMFPVSCAVTSPLIFMLSDKASMRDEFPTGLMFLWIICAAALWIWGVRKYNIKKAKFVIKPNEGVIFGGKQLPFSEIQSIGTINETTGRNAKGTAYVYANSHGQQIKITGYVPLPLADALAEEIKTSSGHNWN